MYAFIVCQLLCVTNYVNYIRGRMYIGNVNTRVEKRNLRSSGKKGWFEILCLLLVGMCTNSRTRK